MIHPDLKLIMAVVLLGGASFFAAEAPQRNANPTSRGLVMKVQSKKISVKVGETPQVAVTITNKGKKAVTLVLPSDGSRDGWRTPITGWSILKSGSDRQHAVRPVLRKVRRCGNINALKRNEVFELAPGRTKKLTDWIRLDPITEPGRYRVVFLYENHPKSAWKGLPLGKHNAAAMTRVKTSTKCVVKSNEIVVTVAK